MVNPILRNNWALLYTVHKSVQSADSFAETTPCATLWTVYRLDSVAACYRQQLKVVVQPKQKVEEAKPQS